MSSAAGARTGGVSWRGLAPPLTALVVVLAGAGLLWAGLSRTSAFGGGSALTGTLPPVTQPVVVSAPGMSELTGGHVTVTASAPAGQQVFIGVGRAEDVEAYLGSAARAEIVALEGNGALRLAPRSGDASLPEPAGVDVWAAYKQQAGTATLGWDRAPGSWRVVIAVDGRTPPASATFTWGGSAGSSPAPALIAIGAVLLAAGIAALLAIRSGRMFAVSSPVPLPGEPGAGGAPLARRRRAAGAVPGRRAADAGSGADAGAVTVPDGGGAAGPELGEDGTGAASPAETVTIQPFRHRDRHEEDDL